MKKFSVRFLFISLIFLVSLSSISFLGYSLNNKINNNTNTEETIDVSEQIKNAFVFNHKKQIEEVKQNKESIKNKINNNVTNMSFSQIKKKLRNKNVILWNYYASYEINQYIQNMYSLNSYIFIYLNKDINIENIEEWSIEIFYSLLCKNDLINVEEKINNNNNEIKNAGNRLILIDDFTRNDYINKYFYNHFFILNLNINNIKINNLNDTYLFLPDYKFKIDIIYKNGYSSEINLFLSEKNEIVDSFNLNYEEDFNSNKAKVIINDFLLLNNNIAKFDFNILLPEKMKIDELLNNLKIYADYKSYDNSKNDNNYELNLNIDDNYYKYSNSNWYNVTIYINNFSEEEGIIYYNFSFFYKNKEFFLNEWINNFKVITPIYPANIKNISYSKNPYFKNSFFIDIKFNEKINYQIANDLILYYKNNGKEKYKNLTNPIYLNYQDIYRYEINFAENEINDENEIISLTNFVFINSGYFEYDYLTNSFVKNYKDNENYINTTGYKYVFKKINFIKESSYISVDVIDSKIIRKGNKYYLDVLYYSNNVWSKKNENLDLIKNINFNYFSYNKKNNEFEKHSQIVLNNPEIKNISYNSNDIEAIYRIPFFESNSIYANINFSLKYENPNYNKIWFLPKKIYLTNFSNKNINNIKIKKIKNNSIIFDVSYNDILKIQANNLRITYKDENGNDYNTSKKQNLTNNGIVNFNNKETTYEYELTNLESNTEYKDFNIYLLKSLNSDYKYDWSYSYFLKPSFSTKKTIKTKNKTLIIFLSLLILILYFSVFLYFLFKYLKYRKSIL